MKPLFKCELNYFPSVHLNQVYDGFLKLRKLGIIDLSIKRSKGNHTKPLLTVVIDNKYTVIYDALDGLNWIDASIQDNLNHFKNKVSADFYFKRSFSKQIIENAPQNCKVYPLGLNYPFQPEKGLPTDTKETVKNILKDNYVISKLYKKTSFWLKDFEYYPVPSKESNILFLARLWDPYETKLEHLQVQREFMNENRIRCIKLCKKEFGKQFVGGLQYNAFTNEHAKELIMPTSFTRRASFLNSVKEHNICIATSGLHNSIGWKFGEYVAASRAIISEPLNYELPGNFDNNKNYLMYNDENELLNQINTLLNNKEALFEMMNHNFQYYNNYLRSDKLVLNTLLKIHQNE